MKKIIPFPYAKEQQRNKYVAVEVQLHALLISALGYGHLHSQSTLSSYKALSIHWLRAMACLEAVARRDVSAYAEKRTPVDQPIQN